MTYEKSCANCKHFTSWESTGGWSEPPDSGWECSHKEPKFIDDDAFLTIYELENLKEEVQKFLCSMLCESYEYFDWDGWYEELDYERRLRAVSFQQWLSQNTASLYGL